MQFIEGLKLHGILNMLREYPEEGKTFLLSHSRTSASEVTQFFKPEYSEDNAQKEKEEEVMYNFNMFLKKIERGSITSTWLSPEENDDKDVDSTLVTVTMKDLLKALLGCSSLPANVYGGLITFDHTNNNISTINTCAPSVNFTQINKLTDYAEFENVMKYIIIGSYGFGIE